MAAAPARPPAQPGQVEMPSCGPTLAELLEERILPCPSGGISLHAVSPRAHRFLSSPQKAERLSWRQRHAQRHVPSCWTGCRRSLDIQLKHCLKEEVSLLPLLLFSPILSLPSPPSPPSPPPSSSSYPWVLERVAALPEILGDGAGLRKCETLCATAVDGQESPRPHSIRGTGWYAPALDPSGFHFPARHRFLRVWVRRRGQHGEFVPTKSL
eukprot:766008-Hanusia_phi.AAC.4